MSLKNVNKLLNNKFKNFLLEIPVAIKVTVWYTFFIVILIVLMLTTTFFAANTFIKSESREELAESVHKMANKSPKKFEYFDDGIFFIKYTNTGDFIDGLIPENFDSNLELSKKPEIKSFKNKGKIFLYLDAPIRHSHHRKEWVRGVLPINNFSREINLILIFISIISPLLLFFIIYIGYKIIKNSFKPVQEISNTVLEIQKHKDFSKRINLRSGKDEIHKMAYSFNKMLDSLENSYIHEKQFSSDVSHELRTPVTVILAESDYAINYSENLDEAKDSLATIQRQAKKMSKLINQIMELAKLETRDTVNLNTLNLSKLIETTLNDYKYLLEDKNINLEYTLENNLEILADKLMIERVIDNLLSNALKFTKSKININLFKNNDNIILEIEDDGIGLSQEECKYIWNRFYQANNSRNKDCNKGYGLGLSMVKKIIELHNASIEISSKINYGAKFTIKFSFNQ